MIEKRQAVERLEEILAVPGIDMIQWGPSDYSMSTGHAGQRGDPEVKAAEKKVFETAQRLGIPARAEIGSPEDAKRFLDWGVRHFSVGSDLSILHSTLRRHAEGVRELLG
jgi:4-hydroxy-2-oxoheptanedioate aldolase